MVRKPEGHKSYHSLKGRGGNWPVWSHLLEKNSRTHFGLILMSQRAALRRVAEDQGESVMQAQWLLLTVSPTSSPYEHPSRLSRDCSSGAKWNTGVKSVGAIIKTLEVGSELGCPVPSIGPDSFYWSHSSLIWSLLKMLYMLREDHTGKFFSILNMKSFINECEGIISSVKYVLMYQGRPPLQLSRLGEDISIWAAFSQQDDEDWKELNSNRTLNKRTLRSKFHLFQTKNPLLKDSLGMKILISLPVYIQMSIFCFRG